MTETNNKIQDSLNILNSSNDYKVLSRVPETIKQKEPNGKKFKAAFIDLETTGVDRNEAEIIEIGVLVASFTNEDGFVAIEFTDNQLQEPKIPISAEITRITGITNDDVKGKAIDWQGLHHNLTDIDLVICHNASFDRQFLELKTPIFFKEFIESLPFGCSFAGVNWNEFGFEGGKLEYLNLKMGYFYEGHRALVDCYATLNLFIEKVDAFERLKDHVRSNEILICAVNAPYNKKDILKKRKYRWSSGDGNLPKCWWVSISSEDYEAEKMFLEQDIYMNNSLDLPTKKITAKERYSLRAEAI
ncbi:MAG: DNA polymerase III subunit epsilon [Alphaproteobacteria bacterium]|jgi:DNA polymerase III subunit epsilon|nr:DNA polymerase III subunit epsilon [Alphaproteobacteria bacterium]MBT5828099.1 DNA polymerase III subunit epsilon [Alphaproteobacteria bacterium]